MRATISPLSTQLMTVPAQGGTPTVLFGPLDGVGEAAYSPDGKRLVFLSVNGMETIDLTSLQRTTIVPFSKLHGSPLQHLAEGVGMSWARTEDKIVLVLFNLTTKQDELWTVTSEGNNLTRIFAAAAGTHILSVTFVSN